MSKFLVLVAAVLLVSPSFAKTYTLKCWKTSFKSTPESPKKPFMTAEIRSNSELADIKFLYKNGIQEEDTPGPVKGLLNKTRRSPYKGNKGYPLKNGDLLILPVDLSNEHLKEVEPDGIGYYENENGVIIGFAEGDGEGGNHYSFRLSCESDK